MSRLAPSPPGSFLTGHLHQIRRDVLGLLTSATRDHGDIVRFRVGPLTMHVVNHPDLVSHVLIRNRANYDKASRSSNNLSLICGESLLTSNGPVWKQRRRMIQPMFHRNAIEGFVDVIAKCTDSMLRDWERCEQSGEPVDVASEMMKLTFRIVGRCLFGSELEREAQAVEKAMHTLVTHAYRRWRSLINLPAHWPTPANRNFRQALADVDAIVGRLMEHHRKNPPSTPDLLTMLMEGEDAETGEALADQHIRNEAITFLLAGHETTANGLGWALYQLCEHPAVADGIRQQFQSVCGGAAPGLEHLSQLSLALHAFEESIRLHPPIWAMERHAIGRDEIAGYPIPKGSGVIISPYLLHRHPAFWDRPEAFLPSRFEKRDHPAYLPFGAGPRFCIGSEFALTEARIILPMILHRYEISAIPGQTVEAEPAITLRLKNGFLVRLKRR